MSRKKPASLNRKQKFALSKLERKFPSAKQEVYCQGNRTYLEFTKVLSRHTFLWVIAAEAWLPLDDGTTLEPFG